ncbi:MAG: hypothetical protein Q9170_008292 [Blastenia crenularia]
MAAHQQDSASFAHIPSPFTAHLSPPKQVAAHSIAPSPDLRNSHPSSDLSPPECAKPSETTQRSATQKGSLSATQSISSFKDVSACKSSGSLKCSLTQEKRFIRAVNATYAVCKRWQSDPQTGIKTRIHPGGRPPALPVYPINRDTFFVPAFESWYEELRYLIQWTDAKQTAISFQKSIILPGYSSPVFGRVIVPPKGESFGQEPDQQFILPTAEYPFLVIEVRDGQPAKDLREKIHRWAQYTDAKVKIICALEVLADPSKQYRITLSVTKARKQSIPSSANPNAFTIEPDVVLNKVDISSKENPQSFDIHASEAVRAKIKQMQEAADRKANPRAWNPDQKIVVSPASSFASSGHSSGSEPDDPTDGDYTP